VPYVSSLVLAAIALLVLVGFLFRAFRALRRLRAVQGLVVGDVRDRGGLLRARMAAVRVAISQRRHRSIDQASPRVRWRTQGARTKGVDG
jgi:hypothetical protein